MTGREHERTARSGEVAAAVGLSVASIQAYARGGRLPYRLTPGRQYRFDVDEVREILEPPPVREVDGLMDVFAGTGARVDALSPYRPSPFTGSATARLRARGHHREGRVQHRREADVTAGARQLADLVERSGNVAAIAVLHRG